MKLITASLVFFLSSTNSYADVLGYTYQGQPLICSEPGACVVSPEPAWTGKFVFDESLLPGGTIAGLKFLFSWQEAGDIFDTKTLVISNQGGTLASYHEASPPSLSFDWSAYGILQGRYADLFMFGVGFGKFGLTFGADKTIIAWSGDNMWGSPLIDPFTSNGNDGRGLAHSIGPGVWTGPGPVPVPAALPLFATGIGVLGLIAWRRKRKAAKVATN